MLKSEGAAAQVGRWYGEGVEESLLKTGSTDPNPTAA